VAPGPVWTRLKKNSAPAMNRIPISCGLLLADRTTGARHSVPHENVGCSSSIVRGNESFANYIQDDSKKSDYINKQVDPIKFGESLTPITLKSSILSSPV
jgi:hypothetical protein